MLNKIKSLFFAKDKTKGVKSAGGLDLTLDGLPVAAAIGEAVVPPYSKELAVKLFSEMSPWAFSLVMLNAKAASSTQLTMLVKSNGQTAKQLQSKALPGYKIKELSPELRLQLEGKAQYKPSKYVMQKYYDEGGEWVEVVGDHPLLNLLQNKSRTNIDTGRNLSISRFVDLQVTGEWFMQVVNNSAGVPTDLYYVPSVGMEIIAAKSGDKLIDHFEYGAKKQYLSTDEIVMGKLPNPTGDLIHGIGYLEAAWYPLWWMIIHSEYQIQLFKKFGLPAIFAQINGATQDECDRFSAKYNQAFGWKKGGSILTTSNEIKLEIPQMTRGMTELASSMAKTYEERLYELASVFGIPLSKLKDTNLANAYVGELGYRREGILYLCKEDEQRLNEGLLWRYGLEDTAMLTYVDIVPKDEQAEEQRIISLYDAGLIKRSQAQIKLGIEPDYEDDGYKANPTTPKEEYDLIMDTSNGESDTNRTPRGSSGDNSPDNTQDNEEEDNE